MVYHPDHERNEGKNNQLTPSGKHGAVNTLHPATIGKIERSNDVASNGLFLVVLAPVDIGTSRDACAVQDMSWLELI